MDAWETKRGTEFMDRVPHTLKGIENALTSIANSLQSIDRTLKIQNGLPVDGEKKEEEK